MTDVLSRAPMTVGEFYKVPAVFVDAWRGFRECWIPVIGPFHEDAGIVGFPDPHFHVDWRFVSGRIWDTWGNFWRDGGHFGAPIQCPDRRGVKVILRGPELRRMKCKRDPGVFPRHHARWIPKLEEQFACAKLVNGLCPHRGIPVSAMHRDGDVLTCPGHGLRWSATTGELVR